MTDDISISNVDFIGRWLDIGGASIRNLFVIGRDRLALWVVLLITATLFHLLYVSRGQDFRFALMQLRYNSMIFQSLSANNYGTVVGPYDPPLAGVAKYVLHPDHPLQLSRTSGLQTKLSSINLSLLAIFWLFLLVLLCCVYWLRWRSEDSNPLCRWRGLVALL